MRKKTNHSATMTPAVSSAYLAQLAKMQNANASKFEAPPEVLSTPVISLTLQSLTIKREGQVEWAIAGEHHCGPKSEIRDGKVPVKYSVSITCTPNLDERGFLFDQAAVDLWMKRQASKVTELSCEELVIETATQMLLKLAREKPHCKVTELVMTLSPAPHAAGVTCRFA